MIEHTVEVCANRGWDDDPDWYAICSCGWETWSHDSELRARRDHQQHVIAAERHLNVR